MFQFLVFHHFKRSPKFVFFLLKKKKQNKTSYLIKEREKMKTQTDVQQRSNNHLAASASVLHFLAHEIVKERI